MARLGDDHELGSWNGLGHGPASAGGVTMSSSPTRTRVGTLIRARSLVRSGRAAIPRKAPATARTGVFSITCRTGSIRSAWWVRVISEKSLGSMASTTGRTLRPASTFFASLFATEGGFGRVGSGPGIHQHQARTRSG